MVTGNGVCDLIPQPAIYKACTIHFAFHVLKHHMDHKKKLFVPKKSSWLLHSTAVLRVDQARLLRNSPVQ